MVQPNRGLVVAGTGFDSNNSDANFALARYSGLGITTLTLTPQSARVNVNTSTRLTATLQTDGIPLANKDVVLRYFLDFQGSMIPTVESRITDALGQANFPIEAVVTPGTREYTAFADNRSASCNVEWVVPSPQGLQVIVRNTSPDGFDLGTDPDTFFPAVFSLFGQYRASLTIQVLYDGVPVPGLSGRFTPDDKSTPDIDEFVPAQVQLISMAQRADPPLMVEAFQILPSTDSQGETTFSYSSSIAHTDSFKVEVTYNGTTTPFTVPFAFVWVEPIPELQIEYGYDYGSGNLIIDAYLYSDFGSGNRLPSSGVPLALEVLKGPEEGRALRTEITNASGFATFMVPRKDLQRFVGDLFETIQVTPVNAALAGKLKRGKTQSFLTLIATEAVLADTASSLQSPLTKDVSPLPNLTLGPLHATPTVGEEVLLPVSFGLDPKLTATGPRHNLGDEAVVFKYLFRARPAGEPTEPIVSATDFGVLRSNTPGTDVVYAEVYIDDLLVSTTNDIAIEWRAVNTPVGQAVVVQPALNELGAARFTLAFDNVAAAGITTVRLLEAQEPRAPAPAGFLTATVGIVVREFSFEVGTTADYTGPIQVRFTVPGYNDSRGYVLCHFVDGAWQQIATDVEDGGLLLEGTVDSLSPFAVFMAEPPPFVGDGNVTARLKGRKLILAGDAGDNFVVVEPGDGGPASVRVLGVGTTINGANDAVLFDNVRRLQIRTRTGNDEIHLDGGTQALVFAGAVRIDAGTGNDVVAALGIEARQAFTIATGAGDDAIDAIDCVFAQAATFDTRRGEDALSFQRVSFALSLAVHLGRNADLVTLRESILGSVPHPRRFRINGSRGADLLDAGLLDSPNAHDNQNVERLRIRRVEQNLT